MTVRNFLIVLAAMIVFPYEASACEVIEQYSARLGSSDHFNSSGERLTSAAAIIRQDRANYHKFGIRDPEDEDDNYFASKSNRAILENLLANGDSSASAIADIVNSQPLVEVTVCRGYNRDFINVIVR